MTQTYLNFINGEWAASETNQTIESINPANNEVIGEVQNSSKENVHQATLGAKHALRTWKNKSPVERGTLLNKAADHLEHQLDDIATTATLEMGKTIAETKGEVMRGVAILRYYAQEGLRQTGEVIPSMGEKNFLYTQRVPVGVVGVISPWNFPIAIPIWKMAPALIYGNTVVFKPATETAITAVKIVEAMNEAGFPEGVINLVTGKGSVVGQEIIDHANVNAITFTGSNQVGKQVAEGAIAKGAKYQLEMGGKNPAIVLEDADLDLAAELSVNGAMKHTGQKCTATSRVFIQDAVYDRFKEKVLDRVKAIKVGDGLQEDVYMGPLASRQQIDKVQSYVKKGEEEGATLIYGGGVPQGEEFANGFFIEPAVFENVTNQMAIAQDEIFGPVLCLIRVSDFDEALTLANDTDYGLSASLFTRDIAKAFDFVSEIEAGLIKVNGESAGVEPQAPFGGMKASSSHSREQGTAAKEFFTSIKTITITPTP
ncbi:alpha-ketoglutaric semialdehyde dehydrogenase GucD [Salsuginibacillus kocurii]|uniref:alpha-ketoglutaric semialdehyde dehydrogenase GucD n=1 Tax=Salsuginibacillus kocurii TaxID=427078 RepID=UPI00035D168C|nr:alpha-ketoglutaric semialdehyde dehydrogenase GucD [Salsuginibacillus kocurii]